MEIIVDKETRGFRPTAEWMNNRYHEMNEKLFDGKLDWCDFNVAVHGSASRSSILGNFRLREKIMIRTYNRSMYIETTWFGKIDITKDNFADRCRPLISLNGNYSGTEFGFLNVLVHEMCHYYTYMRGIAPKQGHGVEFRQIGNYVCYKSNGLFNIKTLATAEDMSHLDLDDKIKEKKQNREENKKSKMYGIFVYRNNGEIQLTPTTSQNLINKIINFKENFRPNIGNRYNIEKILISNDEKLINILYEKNLNSNSRSWSYYTVTHKDWIGILDEINKKVYYYNENGDMIKEMNESRNKRSNEDIITEVINRFINEKRNREDKGNVVIEITPDMDLGQYSPYKICKGTPSFTVERNCSNPFFFS